MNKNDVEMNKNKYYLHKMNLLKAEYLNVSINSL